MIDSILFYLTCEECTEHEWKQISTDFNALFPELRKLYSYEELKYHKYIDPYKIEIYGHDMPKDHIDSLLFIFGRFAHQHGFKLSIADGFND